MASRTDDTRRELLDRYRASGLTQDAFCAELRRQGTYLSPRTLRAWGSRFGMATVVDRNVHTVVDRAIQTLEALLCDLRRLRDRPAADEASPSGTPERSARQELTSHDQRPTGMPPAGTSLSASQPLPTRKKRGLNWDLA